MNGRTRGKRPNLRSASKDVRGAFACLSKEGTQQQTAKPREQLRPCPLQCMILRVMTW